MIFNHLVEDGRGIRNCSIYLPFAFKLNFALKTLENTQHKWYFYHFLQKCLVFYFRLLVRKLSQQHTKLDQCQMTMTLNQTLKISTTQSADVPVLALVILVCFHLNCCCVDGKMFFKKIEFIELVCLRLKHIFLTRGHTTYAEAHECLNEVYFFCIHVVDDEIKSVKLKIMHYVLPSSI